MKVLIENRKARFDYAISEYLTAGVVLTGAETKSLKNGQASLAGAFVVLKAGEPYLINAHISPYKFASQQKEYDPERERKLLLGKKEIASLIGKEKGTVIVPLQIIESEKGLVKAVIGIGKGKKKFDKRETIKRRETEKKIRRFV